MIVDATPYELYTSFDKNSNTFDFYFNDLNKTQIEIINKIIKIKDFNLIKIERHDFPEKLLKDKLPQIPPQPVKKGSVSD